MLTALQHRRLRARSRLRCKAEVLALLDARLLDHPGLTRTVFPHPALPFLH